MKKLLLKILPFILISVITSCERAITYESHYENLTDSSIDICATVICPKIDLNILVLDNPSSLQEAVSKWITTTTFQLLNVSSNNDLKTLKQAVNSYINESQIAYPETVEYSDAHEIKLNSSIAYSTNKLLSVLIEGYQFSGGAHVHQFEMYGNFDPKTGSKLNTEALFEDGFYAFAKAELEKSFANENFTTLPENYRQIGFTEKGIKLIYNNLGENGVSIDNHELLIPWEEGEDYIKL